MPEISLARAFLEAIALEDAAVQFYTQLANRVKEPAAERFFNHMARRDAIHASEIRIFAASSGLYKSSLTSTFMFEAEQSPPDWSSRRDSGVEFEIAKAVESVEITALLYDNLAGEGTFEMRQFFAGLAAQEHEHARLLKELIDAELDYEAVAF